MWEVINIDTGATLSVAPFTPICAVRSSLRFEIHWRENGFDAFSWCGGSCGWCACCVLVMPQMVVVLLVLLLFLLRFPMISLIFPSAARIYQFMLVLLSRGNKERVLV